MALVVFGPPERRRFSDEISVRSVLVDGTDVGFIREWIDAGSRVFTVVAHGRVIGTAATSEDAQRVAVERLGN